MNLRPFARFVLGVLVGGLALPLGLTVFPVVDRRASWRPFFVVTTLLIVLVLVLGWLVARVRGPGT